MPQLTSIRPNYVYTLRRPLRPGSPVTFVLVLTAEKFTNRHFHEDVSVLVLLPEEPKKEIDVRVKINCRERGGSARLPQDHWVAVDAMFPLRKEDIIVTSATPITDVEEQEVRRKLKDWLGL